MDVELVRKNLKIFSLTTTNGILVKLITIISLHKLFHVAKNLGVNEKSLGMSQKISFLN